jgi:hypothetical protein
MKLNKIKEIFGGRPRIGHSYRKISVNYKNSKKALNKAHPGLGDIFEERLRGVQNKDNFTSISQRLIRENLEDFEEILGRLPEGVDFGIKRKCNNWVRPPRFRWGLKISFEKNKASWYPTW